MNLEEPIGIIVTMEDILEEIIGEIKIGLMMKVSIKIDR